LATIPKVEIPSKAVSGEDDLGLAARNLLEGLNLLPPADDLKKADGLSTAFTGPPDSVALIEAGATAATKWWSAGLGATVTVMWGKVWLWWGSQPVGLKAAVVGGAAFVTAAVAVSIAYLLSSDVRGRAHANVATIEARARVAVRMIEAAQAVYVPPTTKPSVRFYPLGAPVPVTNTLESGGNEDDWLAIAVEHDSEGGVKYVVVKHDKTATVEVSKLRFV